MDVYRLSRAAQRAIEGGEREARSLGHNRLETAHVLLGLFGEKTAGSVAMRRAGIGEADLRSAVDSVYDGPREGRPRDLDRTSGEMREAFSTARDEADGAGEHDIAPVRLFLALTEDEEWSAYRALEDLGADVERLRQTAESLARDEAQGSLPE